MLRIAEEKRLPFTVQVPNASTKKAMEELESGHGKRFDSSDELFDDLGI
jgi:DNA-damage-inducible protein J